MLASGLIAALKVSKLANMDAKWSAKTAVPSSGIHDEEMSN